MNEAVELEEGISPKGKAALSELLTGGRGQNFRRVCLGVVVQCFQQITGINLITYYAVSLLPHSQSYRSFRTPDRPFSLNVWVCPTSSRVFLLPATAQSTS